VVSSRINPRSRRLLAAGRSLGRPAFGPPRQALSEKPSATVGKVEKNMSSSRRMWSRSAGVRVIAIPGPSLTLRRGRGGGAGISDHLVSRGIHQLSRIEGILDARNSGLPD
jgi:hypothetical protein